MTTELEFIETLRRHPRLFFEEFLGVQLWSKQLEILESVRDNKLTAVRSGHSVGKACKTDTPVITPFGFKQIQHLKPGDTVYDEAGQPCKVTWHSGVMEGRPCYEVTFDDGNKVICDEGHDWEVWTSAARRNAARGLKGHGPIRMKTGDMVAGVKTKNRGFNYGVAMNGPVQFSRKNLPIDPYVLGVWLGDGTAANGLVTNADPDVWLECARRGYYADSRDKSRIDCAAALFHLACDGERLTAKIRRSGLRNNKHIPEVYFRGSVEQRLDLLRGLMDTDGCCDTRGCVEFCNTNVALAKGAQRLCWSLGIKCSLNLNRSTLYGVEKQPRWRLTTYTNTRLFNIRRKAERQSKKRPARYKFRIIRSIKPVESVPVCCITVDSPSHLFLCTEACIPTSNSFIAAGIPLWFVMTHEDATVLTTASSFDQVVDVVWRQMRKLHEDAKWPIGGKFKPSAPQFESMGSYMRGFSPANPGSVNGRHSKNVLVIFDEAQELLDAETWNAFDSLMSTEGAKWLAIGNPLYNFGPFYQLFKSPAWHSIKMSCLEHPNVIERRGVIPGAVGYDYIENVIRCDPQKGPGTLYWETRVEGEFPSQGADNLFPELMVERCVTTLLSPNRPMIKGRYIGLDPAEMGTDSTVAAVVVDGVVEKFYRRRMGQAKDTVNWVMMIAAGHEIPYTNINYDSCGPVGSNLTRAFELAGVPAHAVHNGKPPVGDWNALYGGRDAAGRTAHEISFMNRRAELHWTLRILLEMQRIGFAPETVRPFVEDGCQLRYGFFEDGKLYIESKNKKYRPRVGRSPDHSDAVVLSLARDQNRSSDGNFGGSDFTVDPGKYKPRGA